MVLEGVSTRKIARITEELCGTSFSKSAVSEVCKSLDTYVNEFRNRPLTDSYPFLTVDATYFKVRENHRVTARALTVSYTHLLEYVFRKEIEQRDGNRVRLAQMSAHLSSDRSMDPLNDRLLDPPHQPLEGLVRWVCDEPASLHLSQF